MANAATSPAVRNNIITIGSVFVKVLKREETMDWNEVIYTKYLRDGEYRPLLRLRWFGRKIDCITIFGAGESDDQVILEPAEAAALLAALTEIGQELNDDWETVRNIPIAALSGLQ